MNGIIELLEKFLNENKKSDFCFSKSEVKDIKTGSELLTRNFIEKNLNWDDVIMVLKEGIIFTKNKLVIWKQKGVFSFEKFEYNIEDIIKISGKPKTGGNFLWVKDSDMGYISFNNKKIKSISTKDYELFNLINELKEKIQTLNIKNEKIEIERFREEKRLLKKIEKEEDKKETERLQVLNKTRNEILINLDKDNNGVPDIIEEDTFNIMLEYNELELSEKEKEYSTEFTLKFVRLSNFLTFKKDLIITLFKSLKNINNLKELEDSVELLYDQIYHFHQLFFKSIEMITLLLENKKIKFYTLYELFDGFGVFDSKFETVMKEKMEEMNTNTYSILKSIKSLESNLITTLQQVGSNLTDSIRSVDKNISETGKMIDGQLKKVNSKLSYNNFISTINTYQNYRSRQEFVKMNKK